MVVISNLTAAQWQSGEKLIGALLVTAMAVADNVYRHHDTMQALMLVYLQAPSRWCQ